MRHLIRKTLLILPLFAIVADLMGTEIRGLVHNDEKEPLIGATVSIYAHNLHTITGLDGSYVLGNVPPGEHLIEVSYIGYEPTQIVVSVTFGAEVVELSILMQDNSLLLQEVEIVGRYEGSSEAGARGAERNAPMVINVISAKSIEASPDLTVANVIQRVSGLTIERNSNGDGQYAIVRGMNKRYNYTLVNGIKIPSPDNENRYVPLDIFPAELLDQLVVAKALTPSMEGDAVGGVVDMRMKDAPVRETFFVSMATGFNSLFLNRPYDYFNVSAVDRKSPLQRAPAGTVAAPIQYYGTQNLNFEQRELGFNPFGGERISPNRLASLSYGNRYFGDKLGMIVAGSYQNTFRGADRIEFGVSDNTFGNPNPRVTRYQERQYSVEQERAGVHAKWDYEINRWNKLRLYNAWLHLQNNETRTLWEDELRDAGNEKTLEYNWRGQVNIQRVYNTTLQGEHILKPGLRTDWSLVYSIATQNMPDNSQIITVSNYDTPNRDLRWLVNENIIRIWESNSDQDYAAYFNLEYDANFFGQDVTLKGGGLYRMKWRDNNFDLYTFKPNPGVQEYIPYVTDYADITWRITGGSGTPSHVLNYNSYENVFAQYLEFRFIRGRTQYVGGLRAEHTDQGYTTKNNNIPDGSQQYWRMLPSLHIKHMPSDKINVRSSYFRSLSRPSFLEIIPYRRPATEEIVPTGGNPSLVAADAHNFDLRLEYFPRPLDQILVGAFYKVINNPIENAILASTDPNFPMFLPPSTTMVPLNLERALNWGFELDFIRYFKKFGIRANYTFTISDIESIKRTFTEITEDNINQLTALQLESLSIGDSTLLNVTQRRPLQGQSRHIANASFLFKDPERGINAQLSMVFTGERIAVVSAGLDTDWWQRDFVQLDFSAEKRFAKKFTAFCKINNILNTPYEVYIRQPHISQVGVDSLQPKSDTETLVRREFYFTNWIFGVRYNL
jgi:hypothetical protein